jgi:outer membrane protein assembly factor BamB
MMQRPSMSKATIALIVVLLCLAGCGGSSRTVYTTSPSASILPYSYAAKNSGIAGMLGSTGQAQWHTPVGAVNWAPLLVGDTIFLCSAPAPGSSLMVRAIRRTDGALLWSTSLGDTNAFNPLIGADANTVLVNTGKSLTAFDAATGHLRWQQSIATNNPQAIFGRPTSTAHIALYEEATDNNPLKLVALHSDTGARAWEHPLYANNVPINGGDKAIFALEQTVYVPDADQSITALNLADGHVRWHSQSKGVVVALSTQTIVIKQGYQPATISGLDVATGQALWFTQIANSLSSTIIAGAVVVTTVGASVMAVDARTGQPLWHKTFDTVYVSNQMLVLDGVLFLYSPNGKADSSPGCFQWESCPNYLYGMHLDTGKIYWTDTLTEEIGQLAQQEGIASE